MPIVKPTVVQVTSGWIGSGNGFTNDTLPIWDSIRPKFTQDFPGLDYEMKQEDSKASTVTLEIIVSIDKLSEIQANSDYSTKVQPVVAK